MHIIFSKIDKKALAKKKHSYMIKSVRFTKNRKINCFGNQRVALETAPEIRRLTEETLETRSCLGNQGVDTGKCLRNRGVDTGNPMYRIKQRTFPNPWILDGGKQGVHFFLRKKTSIFHDDDY